MSEPTYDEANVINEIPVGDPVLAKLLDAIAPVSNMDDKLKVLVYGEIGSGKTIFSATAPMPLIYDVENSKRSLANHLELNHVLVMGYRSLFQLEKLLEYLERRNESFEKVETLVIDTFSELANKDLDTLISGDVAEGKDYQRSGERMRRAMTRIRDLDRHIVLVCHAKHEKNEATGVIEVRPDLPPKLSSRVLAAMDIVAYMTNVRGEAGVIERHLQVRPSKGIAAKSRIGRLPDVLINPSFDDLLEANTKDK